jgi:hypothetical protein
LLIQPGFQLSPDDYPPKVVYIFEQAKGSLAEQSKKSTRPKTGDQKAHLDQQDIKQPEQTQTTTTHTTTGSLSYNLPDFRWYISPEGRWVILFGEDSDSFSSGPGASLTTGVLLNQLLNLQLSFAYAYHPSVMDLPALRSMSLNLEFLFRISLSPFALRFGGGAGVLSMGTGNRYDHWGLNTQLCVSVVWPENGWWAIVISIHPSWVIIQKDSSFYLPLGVSGYSGGCFAS